MKKQTIATRLRVGFLSVASLVALCGIIGIYVSSFIAEEANHIFDELLPVAAESDELEKKVLEEIMAMHSAKLGEQDGVQKMEAAFSATDEQLKVLESISGGAVDQGVLNNLRLIRRDIIANSEILLGQDEALGVGAMVAIETDMDLLIAEVDRLVDSVDAHMAEELALARKAKELGLKVIIGVSIIAFVIAFILGSRVSSGIVGPLQELVLATGDLAKGNLNASYKLEDFGDEIGEVNRGFRTLLVSQREITDAARQISTGDLTVSVKARSEEDTLGIALAAMIESLRMHIQTVVEGTNTLAGAVQEISASSAQLAASSAENATAISQTTSTIEEVRQTTDLASKKSRQLADEAHENRETAVQGLAATNQTVDSIAKIQEQMTAIADTIIALSQQSQSIGQIIASVDSIAEQSNVLAVNASIEAAKAGDQGRGFSVVAQEVKNLAEQSKAATNQVRSILNEIQHSTNSAIMATEQGTKVVEKGTETAKASGKSIESLADNVDHSTDAATQIASASQQQRVGMDQISSAMENVREASQENASSAKQLEAAVNDLNQLGADLRNVTEKYKT